MPKRPNDPVVQWLDFPGFGKSQLAATDEQLSTSSTTPALVSQCVTSDGATAGSPLPGTAGSKSVKATEYSTSSLG